MLYEKATAEIISFDGLISSTIVGSKTVYGSLADYVVSHCACETVGISYGNDGNGGFTCTPFN